MSTIVIETLGTSPIDLNKVQLARFINSKYNIGWDNSHYYAMMCVLTRIESRIKEMFYNMLGEHPTKRIMNKLFNDSLNPKYDYVHDWIYVEQIDEEFTELIELNINQ